LNELEKIADKIFEIGSPQEFNELCLRIFRLQSTTNPIYRDFLTLLNVDPYSVHTPEHIPFLPVDFFKTHRVVSGDFPDDSQVFTSSGTTGSVQAKHHVVDLVLYEKSFIKAFESFYGSPETYRILALLPSYLERSGSSLIYMVNELIRKSGDADSGFFLNDTIELRRILAGDPGRKTLLIGVSFALLDLVEKGPVESQNLMVMETGGMKGRRKEMIRAELHEILKAGFKVDEIHSEYGMTELLSQAYSSGDGKFHSPPWMKILIRDTQDPLSPVPHGRTGAINVIDLANLHSCSFISTSDLGRLHEDGSFEVLGRMDYSDIRGCNLMVG
jgi:hypothetical protein